MNLCSGEKLSKFNALYKIKNDNISLIVVQKGHSQIDEIIKLNFKIIFIVISARIICSRSSNACGFYMRAIASPLIPCSFKSKQF